MESFFESMTPWARDDGSLHVYVLPDESLADRLDGAAELLVGAEHLPRMPRAWLHFTVARLAQFDDIGQSGLSKLCDALGRRLASIAAFTIELGRPQIGATSVGCEAPSTPQWDELVQAVRGAAADAFPEEVVPAGPHGPHVSLAYATGPVDDGALWPRVGAVAELGEFKIRQVHLVSVTVRPELGTFDWTELANWDLRGQ